MSSRWGAIFAVALERDAGEPKSLLRGTPDVPVQATMVWWKNPGPCSAGGSSAARVLVACPPSITVLGTSLAVLALVEVFARASASHLDTESRAGRRAPRPREHGALGAPRCCRCRGARERGERLVVGRVPSIERCQCHCSTGVPLPARSKIIVKLAATASARGARPAILDPCAHRPGSQIVGVGGPRRHTRGARPGRWGGRPRGTGTDRGAREPCGAPGDRRHSGRAHRVAKSTNRP